MIHLRRVRFSVWAFKWEVVRSLSLFASVSCNTMSTTNCFSAAECCDVLMSVIMSSFQWCRNSNRKISVCKVCLFISVIVHWWAFLQRKSWPKGYSSSAVQMTRLNIYINAALKLYSKDPWKKNYQQTRKKIHNNAKTYWLSAKNTLI